MPAPLDAITVIHNAFRRDMTEIDGAVGRKSRAMHSIRP
jgi:hypothetical protein